MEDKQLQSKSHIIPQFMYDQVLGKEGYFHKIKKNTNKEYSSGKTIKKFQKGEYDRDILCAKCENEVLCQRYEDYAAKVYQFINNKLESYRGIKIEPITNEYADGNNINGIDYTKFKLFLLSILWRASISKRVFFGEVKLGNKHEEIIRKMIFDENQKQPEDYPCFICDIGKDQPILKGWIFRPRNIKERGNVRYQFTISGIVYVFTISKFGRRNMALEGVINQNNSMIIWKAPAGLGKYRYEEFKKSYN
ncbi:MAG: hypothetical protein IH875_03470 [Candidatus Dadabacteria bacterium]|nr:hypothetical protein [Candidatus Dadabacteria bacterium]